MSDSWAQLSVGMAGYSTIENKNLPKKKCEIRERKGEKEKKTKQKALGRNAL